MNNNIPIEMSLEILEKLSVRELLPYRTMSVMSRDLVDDIIRRRHRATFGTSVPDKSVQNKIKDLILEKVTLKLQNLDNSLRTRQLLDLDQIKDYGYTMITVNKYYKPLMNLKRSFYYDRVVDEEPSSHAHADAVRVLLLERDTLLKVFPSFRKAIVMGYHYQISTLRDLVWIDDIDLVEHLDRIGELNMKEYREFMSLTSSERQQLVEKTAKPLYDAYMKLHKYNPDDTRQFENRNYYRYIIGNSRGTLLYKMLFTPSRVWAFPYEWMVDSADGERVEGTINDWYNRIIPDLIDLDKRITSEERKSLEEYLNYKKAAPRYNLMVENLIGTYVV